MSTKKRSSNNKRNTNSKKKKTSSNITDDKFSNENENIPQLLLQSNDEFNALVIEYNIAKETNVGSVLNIEKQVRDKICFLNGLQLFEPKIMDAHRLILFIFMDFHAHIVNELDRINEKGIIV